MRRSILQRQLHRMHYLQNLPLTPKDLQPMIGRMNRVYEILSRKRPLTLPMIWKLHQGLGIPAENLIRPSAVSSELVKRHPCGSALARD
jgi:plasmid maintenance system antidote protein VapI